MAHQEIPYDSVYHHQPPSPGLQPSFSPDPNRPRFYGVDPGAPQPRYSYASETSLAVPPSPGFGSQQFYDNESVQGLHLSDNSQYAQGHQHAYDSSYRDDPDAPAGSPSYPLTDMGGNRGMSGRGGDGYFEEKRDMYAAPKVKTKRTGLKALAIIAILLIVAAAVVVPVYFFVIRPKTANGSKSGSSGAGSAGTAAAASATGAPLSASTSGGDGSKITLEDGREIVYSNNFGGTWYFDPADPFNNNAQAQSYSPPLNQTWKWGVDKIYGVNLGGWLNLEPFITPALYEKYQTAVPPAIDEWTLAAAMAADTSPGGGLGQLEDHYKTFITEEDFAAIAAAGLNWVRIPLGFWAIETYPEEPFLPKVSWTYFLKAIQWARKYGIRINIDFHALPGSQNGWNHSGKGGSINFLKGVMGLANAQRSLSYIRVIAEFISQPQYRDVIPFFGITNEAQVGGDNIPKDAIRSFYLQAYNIIRKAGGTGEGNGPIISIHDGFGAMSDWVGYLGQPDRLAMDQHPYNAFGDANNDPLSTYIPKPCNGWASDFTTQQAAFGITGAGEFSNAINDCGLYVNGVGLGTRYEGNFAGSKTTPIGSCTEWTNYAAWDAQRKADLKEYMMTQMESLQNWFFWTWRIGNSSVTGQIEAPFWSYTLALQEGWAPADPRDAQGACLRHGSTIATFAGPFQPYQTGGTSGNLDNAQVAQYPWPPTTIGGEVNVAALPTFTATGAIPTLAVPTFTSPGSQATIDAGSGWANPADTDLIYTKVAGCTYPDAWNAVGIPVPAACVAARAPSPMETGLAR